MMSSKTIDRDLLTQILFSRLTWPSLLVQERAANSIGSLILDEEIGAGFQELLLKWMSSQLLESMAAKAILVLLRSKILNPTISTISINKFRAAYPKRSLLSWLLFSAYDSSDDEPIGNSLIHSGSVPDNYPSNPFFMKFVKNFLPPIYDYWAKHIEKEEGFLFHKQWEYEWITLINQLGTTPSVIPMDRFWGAKTEGLRYSAIDTNISEVYRSAFLRALAYTVDQGFISEDNALLLAAETCPIDLELWQISPEKRPDWWPKESIVQRQTDSAIGAIWDQVENLWFTQLDFLPKPNGEKWILGEATGFIQRDKSVYDLEIYGAFQKCHGPESPDLEEIISWFKGEENRDGYNEVLTKCDSLLHFAGLIMPVDINELVRRFGDWTLMPISGWTHPITIPRWQAWRMHRKIWLPAPCLGDPLVSFLAEENSLIIRDHNQIIGKWNDWTDGISEKYFDEIPPRSGQYLLLSKDVIEEFTHLTNSTFCWLCRLNIYYKKNSYDDYKLMTDYRAFGESKVIKSKAR
jgi:hypothetical protein